MLLDALAYCINLALGSGLQLSWKVHDSSFGTSASESAAATTGNGARLPCLPLERKERRHLR